MAAIWPLHGLCVTVKPHWAKAAVPHLTQGCLGRHDLGPARGHGCRVLLTGLLVGLQLLALILASSPNWHRSIHEDNSHLHHQCLATLLEQGKVEDALPASAAPEPFLIAFAEFPLRPIPLFQPALGLPPSRGPPA